MRNVLSRKEVGEVEGELGAVVGGIGLLLSYKVTVKDGQV